MRVLIQRVSEARVQVDERMTGEIGPGFLLLVGIQPTDTEADLATVADKIANLRVFEDPEGKMNLSALNLAESGEPVGMLVVSQFTLYGDIRKGRRPSFTGAAGPDIARPLVERFAAMFEAMGFQVGQGEFGAHMQVSLVNDGPVTIWIDSDDLKQAKRGSHG